MANIRCVLYPDPETEYPSSYARDSIPVIAGHANGKTAPSPHDLGFGPGEVLGCVSGELRLRAYLEALSHQLVVTSDKEGADSEFECQLPDAEIVIRSLSGRLI